MSKLTDRVLGPRRAAIRSFHETERNLVGVNGPDVLPHNETGVIGWGTSWRMQGHLLMAERTGRPPLCRWSREVPRLVRAVRPPAPPLPLMGVDTYCAALLSS
ncbi:hypothetical protein [Streptomyces sp. NPDC017202]|uniref:hypothetical protein n=1 Tax=Streptomyces sp. NPDC017202 TaxID=3364981 RepID=UPI00378AEC18